jgi:hypothetical protein
MTPILQRKPPATRLVRMVGPPEEVTTEGAAPVVSATVAASVQATIDALTEAVGAAKTEEQVKQAVRDTFAVQPALSAAQRAKRWREKQKQSSDFNKKEAERKQAERAESERKEELRETLESGQFPVNLNVLRNRTGPTLILGEAPQGRGRITTGGYDAKKIGEVNAAHRSAEGGLDPVSGMSLATAKHPKGHGPKSGTSRPENFAPRFFPSAGVRVMRSFIQNNTTESPMMVCLKCKEQIAPKFSFEAGFNHFHDKHPDRFQEMMARVLAAQKKRCPNDHAEMIESAGKYGGEALPITCGRCKRIIWKPPKPERSDKPSEAQNAA